MQKRTNITQVIMFDIDPFLTAFKFATIAHNEQRITGSNLPYITHITNVCFELINVLEETHDNNLIMVCAALHDTIEDTATTYEELKNIFGEKVADGVQALSKNYLLPKEKQLLDSLDRILMQPVEIQMVKLADRIANLNPPPSTWNIEKIEKYYYQSCELYEKLHQVNYKLSQRFLHKLEQYQSYFKNK